MPEPRNEKVLQLHYPSKYDAKKATIHVCKNDSRVSDILETFSWAQLPFNKLLGSKKLLETEEKENHDWGCLAKKYKVVQYGGDPLSYTQVLLGKEFTVYEQRENNQIVPLVVRLEV
jgi:hypothetical protein